MRRRPRLWPVLLATLIGVAILCGFGVWQLQRLDWKQRLIAEIDARAVAQPVSLATAKARSDIDYLRVRTTGTFLGTEERHVLTTQAGEAAFSVVAPFVSDDGILILADRGVVPAAQKDPARRTAPAGTVTLTGQLLKHDGGQGLFVPENDEAGNHWYWWDIPAMLGGLDVPAGLEVAPYILHVEPGGAEGAWPRPQPLTIALRNNHLGYALTWFGLAAALIGVAGAFVLQRVRPGEP